MGGGGEGVWGSDGISNGKIPFFLCSELSAVWDISTKLYTRAKFDQTMSHDQESQVSPFSLFQKDK